MIVVVDCCGDGDGDDDGGDDDVHDDGGDCDDDYDDADDDDDDDDGDYDDYEVDDDDKETYFKSPRSQICRFFYWRRYSLHNASAHTPMQTNFGAVLHTLFPLTTGHSS